MAHSVMFRDDDPVLARVRRIALGFPAATEKISHGRPAFYTAKVFAYYGGSVKVDGVWVEHEQSLLVLPDQRERKALLADSRTFVPGYLGSYGWIGFDLGAAEEGWEQVGEVIDSSYPQHSCEATRRRTRLQLTRGLPRHSRTILPAVPLADGR